MKQFKTIQPGTPCTYPGEYIPAPLTLDELMTELQHPHEGESKPLINVTEMTDAFIVEVAAPGLNRGDFYVSLNEDLLTISVLHKDKEPCSKKYLQHEFNYTCFKREIVLPGHVDADFSIAVYNYGILYVRLPKSEIPVENYIDRMIIY